MDHRSSSPFIHERDAVDEEYVMSPHVEINNIADQLVWENENEEVNYFYMHEMILNCFTYEAYRGLNLPRGNGAADLVPATRRN
jgi:hypothetical protein